VQQRLQTTFARLKMVFELLQMTFVRRLAALFAETAMPFRPPTTPKPEPAKRATDADPPPATLGVQTSVHSKNAAPGVRTGSGSDWVLGFSAWAAVASLRWL